MYPPNRYTSNRVENTRKSYIRHVIITIMQTRCIHGNNLCSRPIWHFSKKIWYPTKWLQNVAMISKILFDLVWWQVWNIDSYHILTKGSLWWNISDNRLSSIGPSYQRTLVKYLVCQCTENRVVMTPLLSSPGVLQVVIMMIACGDHGDDKVGIVTIFDFRCYIHGLVNITITIAIHCHLLRFLESESLSC